ncbi:AlpA family phage regulatory protein [Salipiger sp. IMCC34102]|uniref:helix-turn-helix transcriptional regulator n=1 Tax=Salipiger sp. IMCC34102 TaxID=2510647 RepID=UPI00101D560B|nr:AlpA family phage regulatory protein [Salipiger sp. IMCC34102]
MSAPPPQLHRDGRPDRLLRDSEAIAMLNIGRSTFHRMHAAGEIPRAIKVGGCTRWWQSEIEAHLIALSESRDLTYV